MTTPTILGYESVASGGNLTIPAGTDVIVGVFFGNPTATIDSISPVASANYSTSISIKVWFLNYATGTKALAGGVTGYFEYLDNASQTPLEIFAGYEGGGGLTESITASAECLVIGGTRGNSGVESNITLYETAVGNFNFRYLSGNYKMGEKTASGATMSVSFGDNGAGAVVWGCAVSIPYSNNGGQVIRWSNE